MSEPPQKKPRLLAVPDGFDVSKAENSRISRVLPPKFENAFSNSDSTSGGSVLSARRPIHPFAPTFSIAPDIVSPAQKKADKTPIRPSSVVPKKLLIQSRPLAFTAPSTDERPRSDVVQKRMKLVPPLLPAGQSPKLKPVVVVPVANVPRTNESPRQPNMKSLSTTTFARATDLSTDHGLLGAATVLFQDSPCLRTDETEADREMRTGVDVSPQKLNARGTLKVTKQGLAAHASAILSREQMAHTLWQKEMHRLLSSPSRARASPDLCFQIVDIIHHPGSSSSMPGIALCRSLSKLLGEQSEPSPVTELSPSFPFSRTPTATPSLILLSFETRPASSAGPIQNLSSFVAGSELWVWKPIESILVPQNIFDILEPQHVSDTLLICNRFALFLPERELVTPLA